MEAFQIDSKCFYRLVRIKCERETVGYVLRKMEEVLGEDQPDAEQVRAYEIFLLGLSPGELAVYCYLRWRENQKTHWCWPSYKTIGEAVGMCENAVSKYIQKLIERGLIAVEPTKDFQGGFGPLLGLKKSARQAGGEAQEKDQTLFLRPFAHIFPHCAHRHVRTWARKAAIQNRKETSYAVQEAS